MFIEYSLDIIYYALILKYNVYLNIDRKVNVKKILKFSLIPIHILIFETNFNH
jgi:hypothetical protein